MVLGCDVRIAVDEAEFWFPEVDLGAPLSPSMTAMLIAHVGPSRAKEMILTCRRYTAAELLSLDLLNQVVAKEALAPTVAAVVNRLVEKKPAAVMVFKATVNALSRDQKVLRADLLLARD